MTQNQFDELMNKLDQLISCFKTTSNPRKEQKNVQPKEQSQFQKAVKIATAKHSTDQEVKNALNTFVESTQILTPSQFAFCVFFLGVNKSHLADDVSYWVGIEIGKHKYNQRDTFISSVQDILTQKYTSNKQLVGKIKTYLEGLKRK